MRINLLNVLVLIILSRSGYAAPPIPFGQWSTDPQNTVSVAASPGVTCTMPLIDNGFLQRSCTDGASNFTQNIVVDGEFSSESFVSKNGDEGVAILQEITDDTGPMISSEIFQYSKGQNDPGLVNYDGSYADLTLVSRVGDLSNNFLAEQFIKRRTNNGVTVNVADSAADEVDVFYQHSYLDDGAASVTPSFWSDLKGLACTIFSYFCMSTDMAWEKKAARNANGDIALDGNGNPIYETSHKVSVDVDGGVALTDINYNDDTGNEYDITSLVSGATQGYQQFLTANNLVDPESAAKSAYDTYISSIADPLANPFAP